MKKGAPGAQDGSRPRECCDVDDGMLILWLRTDQKMDIVGSQNGEWKFGKRPIYSCRAHIATLFVPTAIVTRPTVFRGVLEIQEDEASDCRLVALDHFLAASLFCKEDRRYSSRDSKFSKRCSIGVVSRISQLRCVRWEFHTRWEELPRPHGINEMV
jgi:hypothetical protein